MMNQQPQEVWIKVLFLILTSFLLGVVADPRAFEHPEKSPVYAEKKTECENPHQFEHFCFLIPLLTYVPVSIYKD